MREIEMKQKIKRLLNYIKKAADIQRFSTYIYRFLLKNVSNSDLPSYNQCIFKKLWL